MPQDVPGSSCMFSALRLGVRHFKKLWLLFVRNNLLRRNPGAKDTHCSWVTHCCQAFSFCLCPAQSWFHSEQLLPSVGHCLGREPWLSRSRVHQGSQGFIALDHPTPSVLPGGPLQALLLQSSDSHRVTCISYIGPLSFLQGPAGCLKFICSQLCQCRCQHQTGRLVICSLGLYSPTCV